MSNKKNKISNDSISQELLLRIVPSAVFTVDLDRKITMWNDMAEKITGYKREEMIGKECTIFADEPCNDNCGLYDDKIEKPILNANCKIRTKSGEIKYVSKNVDYLRDKVGNIAGGIETFHDVTQQREIENEQRKSEAKFKDIWGNSIDGLRITDREGVIKDVNDAFCVIMRKEKEELIGKKLDYVYSSKSDVDYLDIYLKRIKNKSFIPREDYLLRLWDDRKMWFSVSTYSIKEEDDDLWISVFRDITDAKKTELIHKVIYEISNAIYEHSELTILLARIRDIIGQIVDTTNFAFALYNEETGMLSIPFQRSKKDHFVETPAKDTFSGYVIQTNESLLMDKETSYKMVQEGKAKMIGAPAEVWMGVPIRVEEKVFGVIVIQDYEDKNAFGNEELNLIEFASDQIGVAIERIRSREELEKSEQALRLANDTKDRFFSIIAHDLKNPFVTLKGFLEILNEDYDDLSEEEIKEYLKSLMNVSNKTFDLLQDLLLWSRAQQNRIEIKKESLNLNKLVEDAVEPLRDTAGNKKVKIDVQQSTAINIMCDAFTIKTVIRNLVSNAIKFSESGGKISIYCRQDENNTKVVVEDEGIGMDEQTCENLFRLDKTVTEKGTSGEEGTGLGLMLCKDFVEKNNGSLTIDSKLGKGTKVIINLPSGSGKGN